jgi:hypothetical protein
MLQSGKQHTAANDADRQPTSAPAQDEWAAWDAADTQADLQSEAVTWKADNATDADVNTAREPHDAQYNTER